MVGRGGRRLGHAWLLVPLGLCVSSCGVFSYHSGYSHWARDPEAEVAAEYVVIARDTNTASQQERGITVVTAMTTVPGAEVGVPSLAAATVQPCTGGVPARSDTVRAQLDRRGGERKTVVFTFPGAAVEKAELFRAQDAVLDVPIFPANRSQPSRCLRVPLQTLSHGTEWRATPYLLGLELRMQFFPMPLPNYDSYAFLIGLPQGIWLNSWRLAVSFEGGLVGERGVVAIAGASPPRAPSVGILGAAFEAGRVLTVRGHLALDLQLGYDVLGTVGPDPTRKPAEAAAYHPSVLQGPRLSLRLLGVPRPPQWRGFSAPPDSWSFGLAAYAGAWWQGAARATPAPFMGLAFEGNIGT